MKGKGCRPTYKRGSLLTFVSGADQSNNLGAVMAAAFMTQSGMGHHSPCVSLAASGPELPGALVETTIMDRSLGLSLFEAGAGRCSVEDAQNRSSRMTYYWLLDSACAESSGPDQWAVSVSGRQHEVGTRFRP